ncbi:hypothetical protein KP509_03G033100 [Ceratopteris richardii]|uniref:Uncharacterized protein n=1 Tax=Ceratopteris richardii TaxID=49495 RepID=A0A8T2V611_CERRI|nr:hypothetical protein KP509_03G033100 [Ceratopteris richardii]
MRTMIIGASLYLGEAVGNGEEYRKEEESGLRGCRFRKVRRGLRPTLRDQERCYSSDIYTTDVFLHRSFEDESDEQKIGRKIRSWDFIICFCSLAFV